MGQMGSDADIYEDLEYCAVGLGGIDGLDNGVLQLSNSGPMSQPACDGSWQNEWVNG